MKKYCATSATSQDDDAAGAVLRRARLQGHGFVRLQAGQLAAGPQLLYLRSYPLLQPNVARAEAASRSWRSDEGGTLAAPLDHCVRRIGAGSTRAARQAGSAHAARAISTSTAGTAANVTRSWLSVWYRNELTARATA